ncbi:hypothetical protein SAMN04487911_1448 [Arenibacter nanhaiticus]|uniref:Uncharacterized protein n=1 Tax=Arenibacter nanhaiticus TaxID=558155 RepID=A0A1M6MLW0_9FLAO|nr:hypothetical protein [Arenibacter nanhaiticus]SHJ84404.1 hypothetical protein SAMN04487911_1448 [Arenibacter nanhaiticus]
MAKKISTKLVFASLLLLACNSYGQLLPGTLDVSGMPNFIQSVHDVIQEAGIDDKTLGFETEMDATEISFTINAAGSQSASEQCAENIYRYSVYMHRSYSHDFEKTVIQAKTYTNSGNRFPKSIPYDNQPAQAMGPRNLSPEQGGQYITIPDDPSRAIKVMEFKGCRTDIPIQYRILPSTHSPEGLSSIDIHFTVVASSQ